MKTLELSVSEILEAIQESRGQSFVESDCYTSIEYADAMQCSPEHVNRLFRRLKAAGQLECEPVFRESLDGRMIKVPGYRIVKTKKAKRA